MASLVELNLPYSACELKKVVQITFGTFDPGHIRAASACEITETELYDEGAPRVGGLNDPRLGSIDARIPCASCHMDLKVCPGHFGHIDLVKPVFHVGFLPVVLAVLRCVCYSCGRLLVSKTDYRFATAMRIKNAKIRLARILAICRSVKVCAGQGSCGSAQPTYQRDNINILIDFSEALKTSPEDAAGVSGLLSDDELRKRVFSAEEAVAIFRRMSREDEELLGFKADQSRPSQTVIETLLVPPPCVRPSVQYGVDRSEDDLTLKLLDILKINKQLKRYEDDGVAQHVVQEAVAVLQYHIATYMNNEIPGLPVATTVKSRKPIKSLRERLKGKEGRLRGNLMGKRVDFSARTVITGDPNLEVDQVGVPRSIAMNLTYPEMVTPMNIAKLRSCVALGPNHWPGARYITRSDGTRFDLRHCAGSPAALHLEVGYKVERHLQDGDYVLFNRQPSLHKMSIMGHRIRVLPWSTFRCNLSVTSPYNADFDGDEMNLHVAQSEETRAEIKHLCSVNHQIISPQGNKPVMGIVQDSLLGLAKMTSRNTFLSAASVMQLCMVISKWDGNMPEPSIYKPERLWTGKQVFTLILRAGVKSSTFLSDHNVNMERDGAIRLKGDNSKLSDNDGRVIIREGVHIAGIICKRTVGSSSGSLIHLLWHEFGGERCGVFLANCQKVANHWLLEKGFTVGVSDIILEDPAVRSKIQETLVESYAKVQNLLDLARSGKLETQPGKSLMESFENRVNQELNQAREISGRLATDSMTPVGNDGRPKSLIRRTNNIFDMVNAGSKGSTINISQIMACVGQQNVEGRRIPFGFHNRTLPHFLQYDYSPDARGFVHNSYLSGLLPHELFFHAMGGREGIIDTACKTSETGYIQRRLVKAMEDVQVLYDRSARNSNGELIQFLYGEDGMAGEYIEDQRIGTAPGELEIVDKFYRAAVADSTDENHAAEDRQSLIAEWRGVLHAIRSIQANQGGVDSQSRESVHHLPVNLSRIIRNAKARYREDEIATPVLVARLLAELLESGLNFMYSYDTSGQNNPTSQSTIVLENQRNAVSLFTVNCRLKLNCWQLCSVHRLGSLGVEWLFAEIGRAFRKSLAAPGEAVGAIAAQSIGEPATQMTLNTFHFAGVGSKNVTLGVPRLRELINVTKDVKTPGLTIRLVDEYKSSAAKAMEVQQSIEYSTLEKIISSVNIIYDPDPMTSRLGKDRSWVSDYYEFPDFDAGGAQYSHSSDMSSAELSKLSRWCLRIHLMEKLITEGLSMREIGMRIRNLGNDSSLHVIWTDDNHEELLIRIRLVRQSSGSKKGMMGGSDLEDFNDLALLKSLIYQGTLLHMPVRGIRGISKVYMRADKVKASSVQPAHTQWILDTDGCNLREVLTHECVDYKTTTSNSVLEIWEVLGIEAARSMLLSEIRNVISFDGSYVNYRHLALLCDVMTHRGYLMPITRNGINRIERGCIAKCSFEETVEILLQAACFGETDYLKGVTEKVFVGQLADFGTGLIDILLDESKLTGTQVEHDNLDMTSKHEDAQSGSNKLLSTLGEFGNAPFSPFSPHSPNIQSPMSQMSPCNLFSPAMRDDILSPNFSTASPSFGMTSPRLNQSDLTMSPVGSKPFSPYDARVSSPFSPFSPTIISPSYSPTSPTYSPTSPILSPTYSPTSPILSGPFSPAFASPTSPRVNSPSYSPVDSQSFPTSSALFSPTFGRILSPSYSPTSPNLSYSPAFASPSLALPMSPQLMSPMMNPTSPNFSRAVASPIYSPSSPVFNMAAQNPLSPGAYSPTAQIHSPVALVLSPHARPTQPLSPTMLTSPIGYDPLNWRAAAKSD